MKVGFSAVDAVFVRIHSVPEARRPSFRARLRHLLRQGLPTGPNAAPGRRPNYTAAHFLSIGVAVELMQLGLLPERVALLLTEKAAELWWATSEAISGESDYFLLVDPARLQSIDQDHLRPPINDASPDTDDLVAKAESFVGVSADDLISQIRNWRNQRPSPRLSIINLTHLLDNIGSTLEKLEIAKAEEFYAGAVSWVQEGLSTGKIDGHR